MKLRSAVPAALGLASLAAICYAQDPAMVGTWVFNPAESLEQKQGYTDYEILTYSLKDNAETFKVRLKFKGSQETNSRATAKFDGKEYSSPGRDGKTRYLSIRQMLPRVEQVDLIQHHKGADGKEVSIVTGHMIRILSTDGKHFTSVLTNAKGDVTGVRVLDKKSHPSEDH